jgi:single-strand DNA-binding protein
MNKVILMGRLTRNADVRWSQGQDQKAIARFTVAVDRKVAKNNDPNQQTADFVSCVAFGKTAEFLEKYGTQGTKFAIEGRIQTGSYTNKDNQKVYTTDVVVESLEFAESKRSQEQSGQNRGNVDPDGFMNIPDGVEAEGLPFN